MSVPSVHAGDWSPSRAWSRSLRLVRPRRSVILCHHGVGESSLDDDPYFLRVPRDRLRAQVEVLGEAGYRFVTVAEFVARLGGNGPPPGLAALSFDDGMADNHSLLLPILQEYAIPATVYVISGLIGRANPFMGPRSGARMMSASELRELACAGVELGAHTVTHPDMSGLDEAACLKEMVDGRAELEGQTGVHATTFAYPDCRYGRGAVRAAERAGFTAAVTCDPAGGWRPFELRRALLRGNDPLPVFAAKVAGAYYPVYDSRPGRIARWSTRDLRKALSRTRDRRRAAR